MTDVELERVVADVHERLLEDEGPLAGEERVAELVAAAMPLAATTVRSDAASRVLARVGGLGPLEPLLADPAVTEVMVNGPGPVWVERSGAVETSDVQLDRAELDRLVERMVAPLGRRVDRRSPWVDGRLPDGSRLNVVVPPIALDGPYVTIRRFAARRIELAEMVAAPGVELLKRAVESGANIVVSGGTGAGKTTLLNALAAWAPPVERIVTVEDAAELRLRHPHVVRMESRPEGVEGVGLVTIRDLVRNALRMRPDRIVVGEVRGGEALDLLQAMNTGHAGCLSTLHANSPDDAVRRLETLALQATDALPLAAVRAQIASAIDLVVQIARLPDRRRRIVAIAEVDPVTGCTRPLVDAGGVVGSPRRPARLGPTGAVR